MLRTKAETVIAVETSRNTYESVNSPENTRILVYFHEGNAELARTITLTHQPVSYLETSNVPPPLCA